MPVVPDEPEGVDAPTDPSISDGVDAATDMPVVPDEPEGVDAPTDPSISEGVDAATDDLTRVTLERDDYLDQLQRTRADFDNYRKRVERERPLLHEAGVRDVVTELLPVLDNLERALEALVAAGDEGASVIASGVDMVRLQLEGLITGRGVQEIPAHGEHFDPTIHEAVQSVPASGHPAGTVVAVVERGYRMSDTVIRPARVIVSGGDGSSS